MINKKAKVKGYAFVMNKHSMPKIDNPVEVPDQDWDNLTKEQKRYANEHVTENLRR